MPYDPDPDDPDYGAWQDEQEARAEQYELTEAQRRHPSGPRRLAWDAPAPADLFDHLAPVGDTLLSIRDQPHPFHPWGRFGSYCYDCDQPASDPRHVVPE